MDRRLKKRRTLKVKRTFEPGHITQASLTAAYERIVPKYAGIVYGKSVKEMGKVREQQKEEIPI